MIATASIALMPIRTVDQVKIGSSVRTVCVSARPTISLAKLAKLKIFF